MIEALKGRGLSVVDVNEINRKLKENYYQEKRKKMFGDGF